MPNRRKRGTKLKLISATLVVLDKLVEVCQVHNQSCVNEGSINLLHLTTCIHNKLMSFKQKKDDISQIVDLGEILRS